MSRDERLHDCDLHLHHETPDAILVSDDGDREQAVWLPKSKIEFEPKPGRAKGSSVVEVTLPEWLAQEKGLI